MPVKKAVRRKRGNRKGFTTGACAAAAARAATLGLVTGKLQNTVVCRLPNETDVSFKVESCVVEVEYARAVVIKDAGDDPDVTDKAHITVDVYLKKQDNTQEKIILLNGPGVGTVTQPGLGLEVNGPAINPVPQKNIRENVSAVAGNLLDKHNVEIIISVPGGEKMALRTLNGRLGIIGGISILGTSGIVHPWSTAAFRSSVIQAIEVAASQEQKIIVLTTGGRTEKFVISELPELPSVCFVQMGDFLKVALDTVINNGIKRIVIGAMVGKLAKMAQGENITHARKNPVNMQMVSEIAQAAGAGDDIVQDIAKADTARYASERMSEIGLLNEFYLQLAQKVMHTLLEKYDHQFTLKIMICDFEGNKRLELDSEQV
ncbi:MAG: cobalt-precorrin-5B (C(1))-methyltransferase [gamma proteobacterium symbiont of Bathyaustriella thionipta]|nr:cobalt-precorrin-5B (C(1))-methyltransferase [gamma proteobacterium symbiont of Bathyaustriella thionipta]MCU7949643.1 cobalt-precorrin-5B (C(1))-methyltransferase [gamma proteobacterium symbiont of Bathyaustriella thionipta]MCU7954834.1 cobalt-precorrin-5B (C(1))-methyltransferase [gamma proteobacterium symbiont of Bathyaustriella thionipta]MCU7956222.1 cobalt-precorrin-5B (C(1))-methyltransferase [gamma proteobacterium symbiont of Bathyaustriella thionipta]MCU7966068.1 cobalt-precorrin-5B 